jgi:NAD(P)H-hydrate epimerase
LAAAGWQIGVRSGFAELELGVLPRRMLRRLGAAAPWCEVPAGCGRPLVLLDGLLGIGASGALRDPLAALAAEMNRLRDARAAFTVAMDLPSGINADTGECHPGAVRADLTLTVGLVKAGLLHSGAVSHVGRLGLIELEELRRPAATGGLELICPQALPGLLGPRAFDFHKGMAGRLGVMAGSAGMEGAAALAATGAVRGGAGLVTLFFGGGSAALLARGLPPEVMVRVTRDAREVLAHKPDALALGPGLVTDDAQAEALFELLGEARVPVVLDAEALNAIARHGRHDLLRENCVITPHPGEMRRLFPAAADLGREETLREFTRIHPCVLLLKGARTLVGQRGAAVWHNATGTPGMACGGQGDLLTGVIGALLAQGVSAFDAARLGAWLCGRAAERAEEIGGQSEQTLTPSATAAWLGAAFADWRHGC